MRAGTTRTNRPAALWRLLFVALVAQTGTSVVEQGVPTLTGFIKDDLRLSAAAAGLVVASFSFGRFFGAYVAGVAADRIGERTVLVAGGIATGALVALASLAPLPAYVVLMVLGGIASASSTPAGGRLVLLAFPRNRHGIALGVRQTGIPIGGLIAAALLPWIAHLTGWRASLAVAGAISAAGAVPLLLEAGVESRAERARAARVPRGPSPFRDRNIRLLTLWGCLFVTGQYAVLAFLALDLRHGAHLSLGVASLIVAVAQAGGIVGRVAWGAASDRVLRVGRKPLLLALTAAGLAGSLALLAVPRSAPLAILAALAFLAGIALIGWQGLWVTMMAELAGPDRAGTATGFAITFIVLAVTVTPPLYGLVADLAHGYRAIWGVLSVVLVAAFVPALRLHERDGRP